MSNTLSPAMLANFEELNSRVSGTRRPSRQATIRVTPEIIPVFMPRDRLYSTQERECIRSLAPIPFLPISLIPTDENPYPPIMNFGWILPESAAARLFQRAEQIKCVRRLASGRLKDLTTYEPALRSILDDLNIRLPTKDSITSVLAGPGTSDALFLALYTNRLLDELPHDSDVAQIAAEFGLDVEAANWYASALYFEWDCYE